MKFVLTILALSASASFVCGQTFFRSSLKSYRQNYYLELKGDSATLFGWETRLQEKDTIYFKVIGKIENRYVRFKGYKFSKTPPVNSKCNYPLSEDDKLIIPFILHSSLLIQDSTTGSVKVFMFKDMYDSNFDEFDFLRIN